MLEKLHIKNYALLDELHIDFARGLNILTGETGTGKSILIGALGLILGERASAEVVRTGTEAARVEGLFNLADQRFLEPLLEELGVAPEEGMLILKREVNRDGRSRAYINGSLATVSALKRMGELLVDLHGQHQHQQLLNAQTHVDFLDGFGHLWSLRGQVERTYQALLGQMAQLKDLTEQERSTREQMALFHFQAEEIARARLHPGEDEKLDQEKRVLENAERLFEGVSQVYESLYQSDGSLLELLSGLGRELAELSGIDPQLHSVHEACEAALYQIQDVAESLRDYRDRIEFDAGRLNQILERLDLLYDLKHKYAGTIEGILAYRARILKEIATCQDRGEQVARLQNEIEQQRGVLTTLCRDLSIRRRKAAGLLAKKVVRELAELGMEKTRFGVRVEPAYDAGGLIEWEDQRVQVDETGADQVEFVFSPNPGEDLKPLAHIASGGEVSRVMLALKSILADVDRIPTLVFDEIDIGISGRIGEAIGQKLRRLAASHQILCVTHLHQVACWGDLHYSVRKAVRRGRTATRVVALDLQGRIDELARMVAGDELNPTAVAHAREMLRGAGHLQICI